MVASSDLPELVLARWLTAKRTSMATTYLDFVGIQHNNGAIIGSVGPVPEQQVLEGAVSLLLSRYPEIEVYLYLRTFMATVGRHWTKLTSLIKGRE